MKTYNIAVLGATGAVGQEMLRVLEERDFPVAQLLPLASDRSAGSFVTFRGEKLAVQPATQDSFHGIDIVLGAADNATAIAMAPAIREAGAVFIDNSSAFRLDAQVPLVIPEVNGADALRHKGILSNPNCTTIITLTAIQSLDRICPIENMVVSSYQAVSGAGAGGQAELLAQTEALAKGQTLPPAVFPYPIAYNLIPQIGAEQEMGYTSEEMKLHYEGRKILHRPGLQVSCTCVRVPVLRSHSISARLTFREPLHFRPAHLPGAGFPGAGTAGHCRCAGVSAGG